LTSEERENQMMEYQVGDTVVHANYGLGEVVKMDEQLIHEHQSLCYVVRIRDLTIWVTADPEGKTTLRLPTPESDFEELFQILQSPGEPLPDDRYERKTELAERMKEGDLASICAVIRDLTNLQHDKKLNDSDKLTLERAQNFLLSEWAYSWSISRAQAEHELKRLLE
jgi:RNA polymerase-interacting CarD/CdnL/TRCF family regulator